ncbi:MAG TPA: hypothetical protein PKY56_02700 [Candidatus Kapabacteria bacterium]|nr:hypothetical protein [Candidatus Kapabacteria bacterium]HPO62495.1 hypothetical protein [Candidatus Kapabacteria bacterium]
MDKTTKIFGNIALWWGVIFSLSSVISIIDGKNIGQSFIILILLGILPLIAGLNILRKSKKMPVQLRSNPSLERQVLLLASKMKGRFTLSEAALYMNLSIDMTRTILEDFITKGLIEIEIDDNGVQQYIYRELLLK